MCSIYMLLMLNNRLVEIEAITTSYLSVKTCGEYPFFIKLMTPIKHSLTIS
jgi:hypothetical protein